LKETSERVNLHKLDVIRTGVETQPPQPISIQWFGYFFRRKFSPMRCNRGVFFDWCIHET
jgi:hypothetical protein